MWDGQNILTLIVRDGYGVTDVDHFWFGEHSNYPSNYHEYDDREDINNEQNIDTAFSFGWKNRPIYAHESVTFSVLLGIGEELSSPPKIQLLEPFKRKYNVNENIRLWVQYYDPDRSSHYVHLKYSFLNVENGELDSYFPADRPKGAWKVFDDRRILKCPSTSGSYPLKIWAEDEFGMKSPVIEF
ncbi:hypothetical protein TVAG_036760 [Trichomonas vaginalis G3]|uniref:Uncharacterized protein n=1 Tax=Trichomonas vaginalis (strain ATCC PRA-98 / G3) TaxID=412133 RepID=A2FXJ7_TRIV3|nr:Listeria-Bacteroides repeat domain (List Bact rpt) family [Trichomonas vaginalis G3]EAX90364.1 hypothetical protein TVAG_036760 [Trichomonas vaginalis G3]KAI5509696.1 Listeria-Bacteroides repeat domain (List Bact rpt) family [Trichomonas vaginalis G3]|eukprot:XP_001303294.1 hypothetical protein [Trichomonas vaginalis G3]